MSNTSKFIPYGRQSIDEDDIQAVVDVLKSDWLTQGPAVKEFEDRLSNYCGSKYAVAVSSGTAALHLACLAAGLGQGDEVITSPITFAASANCALYVNARPVFTDIDIDTICMDPGRLASYLETRLDAFSGSRAVIPVHFSGLPCDMETINKIAEKYSLIIIEDACHALGAEYKANGKWLKVGGCRHSDMSVFSFHPVKHITTGEGGAVLTNNSEYYERLLLLRSHGITKSPDKFINKDSMAGFASEPWYYEMQELGFNYRVTDIQCALGVSQLKKLDMFVSRRRGIAATYNKAFGGLECVSLTEEGGTRKSAYHLYVLQIDFEKLGKTRSSVMRELREKGIGTQVHYIPVHLQPYYRNNFAYRDGQYPLAEKYFTKGLSLPIYPGMTDNEILRVVTSVRECLNV